MGLACRPWWSRAPRVGGPVGLPGRRGSRLPRPPVRTHRTGVAPEHSECGPCDGGTEFLMLFTFNIGFNGLIRSRPAWLVAASLASTDRKRGCLCGRKHVQKHALTALLTGSKKRTFRFAHTVESASRNCERWLGAVSVPRSDTVPVSARRVPTVRSGENGCTTAAGAVGVRRSRTCKAELSRDTRIPYCATPFFKPQRQAKQNNAIWGYRNVW